MSTKHIATSTLWQVASQATMAALSIITVKFVAIGLSKELAGNYNSAYGFLQLFGILADFGLYAVAVREVSRAPEQSSMHGEPCRGQIMGGLVLLRLLITLLSLGAALLLVWIIPAWQGTPLPMGVLIASLVPFFTLLAGIQRTIFQVHYKMHYVFIAEVTQRILTVSIVGALVLSGARNSYELSTYYWFLGAGGIGSFVLLILSTFFAHKLEHISFSIDRELLRSLLIKSAPYGLAFLCMALYRQLDVTLIALIRDDYEVQNAYYGFALRAVEMGYLFPTFLLNSTLPMLSKRDADGEDTRQFMGKIFFAILLLGSTMLLFSTLWARPIMALLTTETYLSAADHYGADTALALLGLPMLLNGIVLFCFYSLLTKHAWKPLASTLFLGAILSLGLNIFLIARFGFIGAGVTSIIVNTFLALALFPQTMNNLPMKMDGAIVRQWLIYTVLLGLILALLRPLLASNTLTVIGLLIAGLAMGGILYGLKVHKTLKVN